jgi:citrate synthase
MQSEEKDLVPGQYAPGLDGVIVAETNLSQVDGERGRLVVRGHDIESLAGHVSFEALCGLLWDGRLPDAGRLRSIERGLGDARSRAFDQRWKLGAALEADNAMDALRASMATLQEGSTNPFETRLRLTGAIAVFAAGWHRRECGQPLLAPDPSRSHAADLLRMIRGETASESEAKALDGYLVTVAEHGMNASTFTARVVASTESDPVSAVVAAIGSLKGPLHGGAPGPVLDMLDEIGAPEHAEAWIRAELDAGRRIMGLGHRIYRVRDPRAAVLVRVVTDLEAVGAESRYLDLARGVEKVAVGVLAERYPERSLETNVEFYTAVLLDVLGIPRSLFTPIFGSARVAGWLAHFDEQRESRRIIRPRQRYVGTLPAVVA